MHWDIVSQGSDSRMRNPEVGAGTLLETGVYNLISGLIELECPLGEGLAEKPKVHAAQNQSDGVDVGMSVILLYEGGRQGILTWAAGSA